jgi:hypothetical protein
VAESTLCSFRFLEVNSSLLAVFLHQVQEIGAIHERQRFVFGEVERVLAIIGGRNQYPFHRAFINDRAV